MKRIYILSGWVLGAVFLLVLILLSGNRILFGNWNPFNPPQRIEYAERRYYKSSNPQVLAGDKKPSLSLEWHPGRIDYSGSTWIGYVPTAISLNVGNNTYITYSLSGGP